MRSRSTPLSLPLLVLLAACAGGEPPSGEAADLILTNGRVVTADDAVPDGEALAIRDGRILAVGTAEEMAVHRGPETETLDLEGRLAIPGFIEGHAHFMGIGDAQLQLNLMDTESWEEIVQRVEAAVADSRPGELIRGRGWHQEKWTHTPAGSVEGIPTHASLSAVSPDNPVVLVHASGHAAFANAKALELAGIDASTADPAGGEIVKDAGGQPTGYLKETAEELLAPVAAAATPVDPRRPAELANQELIAKGITSFQDAGAPTAVVDLYKEMVDAGDIDVRLWVMLGGSNADLAEALPRYRMVGYGDNHLTVRAIKRYIDGALGSHGAWLLAPYTDLPTSSGLNTVPISELEETARLAAENDYQLCIHAIGDRGNREVLDIFAATFADHPEKDDWRWRVEHAQHLDLADIPRFAELGVIASMQGIHATSDAPFVPIRLGDQRAHDGAYVWQSLMQSGAVVMNGTDAPVEDVDPIANYYATVSRRTRDGSVFYPDQRMSRMEALKSYTIQPAYGAFEEDLKGTLTPGKLADVVVLSQDILEIAEEEIPSTEVVYTIIGGRVVYRRP
ncbi:MAG: amidohydrolase [Gemmatimonadota bacterium]|nr:amidohydrolase [Gemmatimonadota bacterium]